MFFSLSLLGVLCVLAVCFVTGSKAGEDRATPIFAVLSARGPELKGMWRELRADWSVRIGEGEGTPVAGVDVVAVRRLDVPLPSPPMEDHLLLANGDCIPFQQLRLSEEKFSFRHPRLNAGKDASLPLSAVSVLWRDAPIKTLDAEKLYRRLHSGKRTRDLICLLNGDVVAGMLTGADKEKAIVEVDERRVTVKMAQVAYIAFNTELAEALRPKGVSARLTLVSAREGQGGRMTLTSASADASTLTGTTVFGARLRVPLRDVAALDLHNGRAVYLSDLKESQYDFQPFLDARWPFAVDGNVAEHDLRLGGSTYAKGVSMHSRSRLSYRLAGAYRRFEALVGLDDNDGRGGAVRIRVWTDGRTLFERELTSHDAATAIRLSVEGVRELTLEVDFGRNGDVCDVVNWADARLIKSR